MQRVVINLPNNNYQTMYQVFRATELLFKQKGLEVHSINYFNKNKRLQK